MKINEVLNENINLKVKNRIIEDCYNQETSSLKKMLNDTLEKIKSESNLNIQEKDTKNIDYQENKKKNSMRFNLQSIGHRKCSSYNYFPLNGERDLIYGENLILKSS